MDYTWLSNLTASIDKVPPLGRVLILIAFIVALGSIPAARPAAILIGVILLLDALIVGAK